MAHQLLWANKADLEGVRATTGRDISLKDLRNKKCYAIWHLPGPCRGCPISTAIQTGKPAEDELTPQNQPEWPATRGSWSVRAAPVRDEFGAIIGGIEVARDITEQKRAEAQRSTMEQRLQIA
jgi:PAS domain-containing protein